MRTTNAMQTTTNSLDAHAAATNTTSDTASDVPTPGLKQSPAGVQDRVAGAAGGLPYGTSRREGRVEPISPTFTQRSKVNTDIVPSLFIPGAGCFVLAGNVSGQSGQYSIRDSVFGVDNAMRLMTLDSLQVQGFAVDQRGNPIDSLTGIKLPLSERSPPSATQNVSMAANIDSDGPELTFSAATPDSTSTWETEMAIYDSLGGSHSIRFYFSKSAPANVGGAPYQNVYAYNVMAIPGELATGQDNPIKSGTLYFDSTGRLAVIDAPGNGTPTMTVSFASAAPNQKIAIHFGDPTTINGGTGIKGFTCWKGGNMPQSESQDGCGMGLLHSIDVDQQGLISGIYSHGPARALAQVATVTLPRSDQTDARKDITALSGTDVTSAATSAATSPAPSESASRPSTDTDARS